MGKAIIIPGVDFSSLGMGKVHFIGEISAPKIIVGQTYSLIAGFDDAEWSVDDETYAEIDSSTGVLTIKPGAWGNEVVVTATAGSTDATASIKLYYSTVDAMVFDESQTIDNTSNFRNGSPGNKGNAQRIGNDKTVGIGDWKYVAVRTNRPADTGYQYSAFILLYTAASSSDCEGNTPNQVCEMNVIAQNGAAYMLNPPLERLLPLSETSDWEGGYTANAKTGETPVSFGIGIDEPGDDCLYSNSHTLRIANFTGYKIELTFFK